MSKYCRCITLLICCLVLLLLTACEPPEISEISSCSPLVMLSSANLPTETIPDGTFNSFCAASRVVRQGNGVYFMRSYSEKLLELCRFDLKTHALKTCKSLTKDLLASAGFSLLGDTVYYNNRRGFLCRLSLSSSADEKLDIQGQPQRFVAFSDERFLYSWKSQDPLLPGIQPYSHDNFVGSLAHQVIGGPLDVRIKDRMLSDYFIYDGKLAYFVSKQNREICWCDFAEGTEGCTGISPYETEDWFVRDGFVYHLYQEMEGIRLGRTPILGGETQYVAGPLRHVSARKNPIKFYGMDDGQVVVVLGDGRELTILVTNPLSEEPTTLLNKVIMETEYSMFALAGNVLFLGTSDVPSALLILDTLEFILL